MTDKNAVVLSQPAKKDTRFVKGKSGNPAGRPKGIKNQITLVKLAIEGELRAQMKNEMGHILKEGLRLAKGFTLPDGTVVPGDKDMIKYFLDKWVTQAKASSDEDTPREKVQILIGRLGNADEPTPVAGRVIDHEPLE